MAEARAPNWRVLRAVALVFLAARLALLLLARPFMDETYYWMWGQHPALSYFDHPALIGWSSAAASLLGWNVVALRLPVLLTLLGDLVLLGLLARRLGGADWQRHFWPVAAIFLSAPIFILLTGSALPDHLLVFFTLAALYAMETLRRELAAGVPRWRFIYLAGLAIGLAMLSKYTGALLGAGLLVAALVEPNLRKLWRSPHFYAAALMALALQAPVLVWNLQHANASFGFVIGGRHGLAEPLSLVGVSGYLLGALAVLSPFLLWAMARFAVARGDGLAYPRALFWLSSLGFLAASLFTDILIHWNVIAYVAALAVLAPLLGSRLLVWGQVAYGALALLVAAVNFAVLPVTALAGGADQASAWSYGWDEVAAEIAALEAAAPADFLAATDYALASPLAFALKDRDVTSLSTRREAYDDWFDAGAHKGQTALIVADRWRPLRKGLKRQFGAVQAVAVVPVTRFGRRIDSYTIYRATDFRPPAQ